MHARVKQGALVNDKSRHIHCVPDAKVWGEVCGREGLCDG